MGGEEEQSELEQDNLKERIIFKRGDLYDFPHQNHFLSQIFVFRPSHSFLFLFSLFLSFFLSLFKNLLLFSN